MNKKGTWIIIILVVLVVVIIVAAKKSGSESHSTVRIGVSSSLTGPAASIGEQYTAGLKVAAKEINAAGGINGKPVELLIEDNTNSAQGGVTAFHKLESEHPDILIQNNSAAAVPAAPLAQQAHIPLFISVVFADVTTANTNSVSFFPTPFDDSKAIYKDMNINKVKNVAVIYVNTEYGKASLNAFTKGAAEKGINVANVESYLGVTDDYSTPVIKLLATHPDAIYVIAINASPVIDYIKTQKNYPTIYSNLLPVFGNLVYKSPKTYEGVHLTAAAVSIPGTPEYTSFRETVKGSIDLNGNALGYASVGYDNLHALADILKKDPNPQDLVQTFSTFGTYKGVNGTFDLTGRVVGMPMTPVIFKNGEIVEVK